MAAQTDQEPEVEEEEATGGRRLDPELRVMGQMLRLLESLDDPAARRVMLYLSIRYANSWERRIEDGQA